MIEDQVLDDPRLYRIRLALRGRGEVTSSDFDRDRPLRLIMDTPIISLTQVQVLPLSLPEPRVVASENEIRIGPDLLRRRQEIICTVLVEGAGSRFRLDNPVQKVGEKAVTPREEVVRIGMLQRVLGWIVVILLVVWIVSNPSGAGDTVHGWVTEIIDFFRHL